MRRLSIAAAALLLGACETLPPELVGPSALTPASATVESPTSPLIARDPDADQQLLELERQLSATAHQAGLGAALAGVLDPSEGIAIRPGAMLTASTVEAGLVTPANAGAMYWQPDRVHVAAAGDMGVTSGRYVQVVSGAEAVEGRYVMVWRRDNGGVWRILTETRVPDPPTRRRRR